MEIVVTFDILAHKYYQNYFRNDYYYMFNEIERIQLQNFIKTSEGFKKIIKYYISGEEMITLNKIKIQEIDNKLLIIVTAKIINKNNYTVDKIKEIIRSTSAHYFPCSSIEYSELYYYKCENCEGRQKDCIHKNIHEADRQHYGNDNVKGPICPKCPVGGKKSDHEHDFEKCDIKLCRKEESEWSGRYDFNIWPTNININDAKYYNNIC